MQIDNFDNIINKFNYCSLTNSLFQDSTVISSELTPERMYRTAQLNWHSIAGALKDNYYKDEQASIDTERQLINLANIKSKISKSRKSQRKLLLLDQAEIELKLQELEASRKLNAPLIKDAINRLMFYENVMKQLENKLKPYEEAERDYHQKRVLVNARAERLSRELGIEKGTILYADSVGADLSEFVKPTDLNKILTQKSFSLSCPIASDMPTIGMSDSILVVIPKLTNDSYIATNLSNNFFIYPVQKYEVIQVAGNSAVDIYNTSIGLAIKNNYNYIFFLQDNILMPNDGLKVLYDCMIQQNINVISGHYYDSNGNPMWSHTENSNVVTYDMAKQNVNIQYLECNTSICCGCMLIKTSIFNNIPFPYLTDMSLFVNGLYQLGYRAYISTAVKCSYVNDDKFTLLEDSKVY